MQDRQGQTLDRIPPDSVPDGVFIKERQNLRESYEKFHALYAMMLPW